jgi:hypothetical protein
MISYTAREQIAEYVFWNLYDREKCFPIEKQTNFFSFKWLICDFFFVFYNSTGTILSNVVISVCFGSIETSETNIFLNLQYDYFSIYLYTVPNAMDDFIVNNEM